MTDQCALHERQKHLVCSDEEKRMILRQMRAAGISGFSAQRQQDAASEEKIMRRRPRWNHRLAFKAKLAVAAIRGEKRLIEMAQDFGVHPNQINQWRDHFLEGATGVFEEAPKAEPEPAIDVKDCMLRLGN